MTAMDFTFSPFLGILGAAVLGGAIGLQRQAAQKPAGFRTHLIVAAASAAFTAMGAHLNDTRIPSYVVVGIGFLGAGAIVRQGVTAHGLTTAASIWMAAAVGLLLGYSNSFGLYAGLIATAITLGALSIPDEALMRMFHMPRKGTLHVSFDPARTSAEEIAQMLRRAEISHEAVTITSSGAKNEEDEVDIHFSLDLKRDHNVADVVRRVCEIPGVRRVKGGETYSGG